MAARPFTRATTSTRTRSCAPSFTPTPRSRSAASRGLAKCCPAQLKETTMDRKTRTLLRVQLLTEDRADTASSVERLMGTKAEVPLRLHFRTRRVRERGDAGCVSARSSPKPYMAVSSSRTNLRFFNDGISKASTADVRCRQNCVGKVGEIKPCVPQNSIQLNLQLPVNCQPKMPAQNRHPQSDRGPSQNRPEKRLVMRDVQHR